MSTVSVLPSAVLLPLQVRCGGYSSAGLKAENQDAFALRMPQTRAELGKGIAALICDGVSSSARAAQASQTCVTSFLNDYFSTPEAWGVKKSVVRVLEGLNSWLYQQGLQGQSMLTTMSLLVIRSQTAHVFHIGDSRIYLWRRGQLECLTRDHLQRQQGRDVLNRAMGGDPHLQVDYHCLAVEEGDCFVLTTDGVHAFLPAWDWPLTLNEAGSCDLEPLAQRLAERALQAGSDDNLSCLLLQVEQLPHADSEEAERQLASLPVPPALQVGHKLDGYRVLEVLHASQRSHLYRVEDERDGQQWAMKVPSRHFADDFAYLQGFAREEWVGRQFRHEQVLAMAASPQPRTGMYYLAELISGQTLRQWIDDHPQPSLATVRPLLGQMVTALRAFQRLDMVHCDLKPENLMLTSSGVLKVIDLGTVVVTGLQEVAPPQAEAVPQGSVDYVAPEYLFGQPASFRADLFSLAVVVYEMLTGQLPYPSRSREQLLKSRSYADWHYIPLGRYRADLPAWVDACLRKALQPNPASRYAALSEFLQDFSVPNRALEASTFRAPLIERHPLRFWQVTSAILLVLLLVSLLYRA